MKQSEFEAELKRDGYEVVYRGLRPGHSADEHSHDWHARVMVLGGEITLTRGGTPQTFHTGDTCAVSAGELHAEAVGPVGVAYVSGRRAA